MSFFVNAPQEETFQLMTDYFKGRGMKILTSGSPSYIKAECGSWTSISFDNSKGEVEINVVKADGGSYTNLNFHFSLEYLAALAVTIIGLIAIYIIYTILEIPSSFALVVILVVAVLAIGITGYSVSLTRSKFIEEFNMFVQSLSAKKH